MSDRGVDPGRKPNGKYRVGKWWANMADAERAELHRAQEREAELERYRRLWPWLDGSV